MMYSTYKLNKQGDNMLKKKKQRQIGKIILIILNPVFPKYSYFSIIIKLGLDKY